MKFTLSIFLILLFALAACAQITIHNTDFSPVGDSYTMKITNDTLSTFSVSAAGANQVWTYDDFEWDDVFHYTFLSPPEAPHGSDFPNATRVTHVVSSDTDSYDYESITASEYSLLGSSLGDSITNLMVADLVMPLPLSYPANWTSMRRVQMSYEGDLMITTDSVICTADAWGTLTTPYGTWQTIRCFSRHYMSATLNGFPVPFFDYQYLSYTWVDQHGNPVMALNSGHNNVNPQYTHGYVSMAEATLAADPARGPLAQSFAVGQNYPNPFNPTTEIPVTLCRNGYVALDVFDELGQLVSHSAQMLPAGRQELTVDGSRWSTGMYFARVTAGAERKVIRVNLLK